MANRFRFEENGEEVVIDPAAVDDYIWDRLYRQDRSYGDKRIPPEHRPWRCAEKCREAGRDAPMHLQQRRAGSRFIRMAVHERGEDAEQCWEPESDEHLAYKERTVRVAREAGFEADTEVRVPAGRTYIKPDALIHGADGLRLDVEIQLSVLPPNGERSLRTRTRRANRAGLTQNWHTDRTNYFNRRDARWTGSGHLPWEMIAKRQGIRIDSGYRRIDLWRCTVEAELPCPDTQVYRRCGKWHATARPTGIPYDDWVRDTAAGLIVPVEYHQGTSKHPMWVPAADRDRYLDLTAAQTSAEQYGGGSGEAPSSGAGSRSSPTCRPTTRVEQHIPRQHAADQADAQPETARETLTLSGWSRVVVDWSDRRHWSDTTAPCRYCRKPAYLRDDQGRPAHKVCHEQTET